MEIYYSIDVDKISEEQCIIPDWLSMSCVIDWTDNECVELELLNP